MYYTHIMYIALHDNVIINYSKKWNSFCLLWRPRQIIKKQFCKIFLWVSVYQQHRNYNTRVHTSLGRFREFYFLMGLKLNQYLEVWLFYGVPFETYIKKACSCITKDQAYYAALNLYVFFPHMQMKKNKNKK